MADVGQITGTIGGKETSIFTGTPGIPGTGGSSGGFLNSPLMKGVNAIGSWNPLGLPDIGSPESIASNKKEGDNTWALIADYFFRAVIIILGFIFMAIGLSMFSQPAILKTVKGVSKKVVL